jgi:hypothetical protein
MRIDLFQPTVEGEARILLLVEAFSRGDHSLEGRTKLAKLDFLLRYPSYFRRALQAKGTLTGKVPVEAPTEDVETRMVRYRYGPWDPSYYAILGRLIGKGLLLPIPVKRGIGYKVTEKGRGIAMALHQEPVWEEIVARVEILRKHFNFSGTTLRQFIYKNFPEVTQASWGESL